MHYTDGTTIDAGNIVWNGQDNVWTFEADPGKFIDYVEFYANNEGGGPKVDLVSVGVQTAGDNVNLNFNIELADGDGDIVQTGLAVTVAAANSVPEITIRATNVVLDEDGFGSANADVPLLPTETAGSGLTVNTGTVTVDFGDDVPAPADLMAAFDFKTIGLDDQLQTLSGANVKFAIDGGGDLVGTTGGANEVIRIEIIGATPPSGGVVTYTYKVTLDEPLKHSGNDNEDIETLSGVKFQVTDSNGNSLPTSGSFDITIVDDVPVAEANTRVVAEGTLNTADVVFIVDTSGSMDAGVDNVPDLLGRSSGPRALCDAADADQQSADPERAVRAVCLGRGRRRVDDARRTRLLSSTPTETWNHNGGTDFDAALSKAMERLWRFDAAQRRVRRNGRLLPV